MAVKPYQWISDNGAQGPHKDSDSMSGDDEGEDVFAMFGSDDEEDDDDDIEVDNGNLKEQIRNQSSSGLSSKTASSSTSASQQLKDQANQRMAAALSDKAELTTSPADLVQQASVLTTKPIENVTNKPTPSATLSISDINSNTIDVFDPPLFLHSSLRLVSDLPDIGGGRGYVSTTPLTPGTLVMVEEPILQWPDAQLGKELGLISVEHMLTQPNVVWILKETEQLYPTKDQVDNRKGAKYAATKDAGNENSDSLSNQVDHMMHAMRHKYGPNAVQMILRMQPADSDAKLRNPDETPIGSQDLLRLLLVLRYNGLTSGLYRHVAMLNHADSAFNCVSLPSSTPSKENNGSSSSALSWTEVRTTRPVAVGEQLTIHYMPRIVCHATRRAHLWDQHRFDIGSFPAVPTMEEVQSKIPPSTLLTSNDGGGDETICSRIESTTEELEEHLRELSNDGAGQVFGQDKIRDQLQALELTCGEFIIQAKNELLRNDRHVLLIPCYRLHLDVCDLVQQQSKLSRPQRKRLLTRIVKSALALLELQTLYYGPHHFELARTHLDLSQSLEELLAESMSGRRRTATTTNGGSDSQNGNDSDDIWKWKSFGEWSKQEQLSRKEYTRIRALFPTDEAEKLVLTNKQSDRN